MFVCCNIKIRKKNWHGRLVDIYILLVIKNAILDTMAGRCALLYRSLKSRSHGTFSTNWLRRLLRHESLMSGYYTFVMKS